MSDDKCLADQVDALAVEVEGAGLVELLAAENMIQSLKSKLAFWHEVKRQIAERLAAAAPAAVEPERRQQQQQQQAPRLLKEPSPMSARAGLPVVRKRHALAHDFIAQHGPSLPEAIADHLSKNEEEITRHGVILMASKHPWFLWDGTLVSAALRGEADPAA